MLQIVVSTVLLTAPSAAQSSHDSSLQFHGEPCGLERQLVEQRDRERSARRARLPLGRDGIDRIAPLALPLGTAAEYASALPPRARENEREQATTPHAPDLSIDRARVHVEEASDGTWLRGATYKARISGDGFTFIPFLGSDVATTFPVHFSLARATIAGGPVDLGVGRLADRSPQDHRFAIQRGDVEVRYDLLGADTIEQTIALDAAGAPGALVLDFDVETEMRAIPQPSGAVRFEAWSGSRGTGELIGGVRYGEATVLDGAGRQSSMATEWADGRLRLTVPAEFLEVAEGPIVVDPLVSTFTVDDVAGFQVDVDVTYKTSYFSPGDYFIYVYEDQFAGNDVDLYTTILNEDGSFAGGQYVELGAESWIDPGVACDLYHALFVAERTSPSTNTREIVSRRMELVPGFPMDPMRPMGATTGNYDDVRPDVASGGRLYTPDVSFIVAWIRDFSTDGDVRYQSVDRDGDLGPVRGLEVSPGIDSTLLAIARRPASAGPNPAGIPIAWGQQDLSTGLWTIEAGQLSTVGDVLLVPTTVQDFGPGARPGEMDVAAPYFVSSNMLPWGIVFDPYDSSDQDTILLVMNYTGVLDELDLNLALHVDVALDQAEPRIESIDERFAVSYVEQDAASGGWRGYLQQAELLSPNEVTVYRDRTDLGPITDGPLYHVGGGIPISRYNAFGAPGRFGALGWATNLNGEIDARGARFDFVPELLGVGEQYCYGNPNSTGERGLISARGSTSSTGMLMLVADRMPLNSIGFFVVGDAPASVPVPGGSAGVLCIGGNTGRYSSTLLNSGSDGFVSTSVDLAAVPQPGGLVASAPGMTWNFSYWHRDAVAGTATSNFTNAIRVVVGP